MHRAGNRQPHHSSTPASILIILTYAITLTCSSTLLQAQVGPDVIVGVLPNASSYGTDGSGIYAYSVGTTSCNIGDEDLLWIASTPEHPVIGQSLYRLKDGRFSHIGQSWLKHGFTALQMSACGPCTPSAMGGSALGVGCSDPYGSGLNGNQNGLGPKFEVNAFTGEYPYPFTSPSIDPTIGRRLQVADSDVDPAQNPGAQYFVGAHYVTLDDAAAGNHFNNASYRDATIANDGNFTLSLNGPTHQQLPAIYAWQAADPEVEIKIVDVPGEGRFYVAYKATLNPGGSWHYEYAIYNHNSHLSAQSFLLPIDNSVTILDAGFRDVNYHSGEPFAGTDWMFDRTAATASWSTDLFNDDENANALRWGTLYNFWFDANSAPTDAVANIATFRPGGPATVAVLIQVPASLGGAALMAPTGLVCDELNHNVDLTWTNGETYDNVLIERDGVLVATLPGAATSYQESNVPIGNYFYDVRGATTSDESFPAFCSVDVAGLPTPQNIVCGETGGDVTVSWSNPFPYTNIEIYRDSVLQASLPGTATSYSDLGLTNGAYTYQIVAFEGINQVISECTLVVLGGPTTGAVLVYMPLGGDFGGNALEIALVSNGFNVLSVTNLNTVTLASFDATFVALGIYPNNFVLGGSDGTLLADYASAGGRVYFEGGDTFAFDSPTALHNIDGIEGLSDGNADLANLTGLNGMNGMDLTSIGNQSYNGENGWIDELGASGPAAAVIWTNSDNTDDVGIFKAADAVGPIIGCSYQFAGIGEVANQIEVMAIYLEALGLGTSEDEFVRGDVNGDGAIDISDAVSLLAYLFQAGTTPNCRDAADLNDDGEVQISDAIYALAYQFTGGSNPPSPFPDCGPDSTDDALDCLSPPCP